MSILAAAVGATLVVVIAALVTRDHRPEQGRIGHAVRDYLAAIDFGPDGYAELATCPLGSAVTLAREADIDLSDEVLRGDEFIDAYEHAPDYPALVQCFVTSDVHDGVGPTSFGVSMSEVPTGSYREFLERNAYDTDVAVSIDVENRRGAAGFDGDVFGYCYRGVDVSGCGADFVDRENGVAFSAYVQGEARTADEAITALDAILAGMIDNLLGSERSPGVPVTVSQADY